MNLVDAGVWLVIAWSIGASYLVDRRCWSRFWSRFDAHLHRVPPRR